MHGIKTGLHFFLFTAGIFGVLDTLALSIYTNINVGTLFPGIAGSCLAIYACLKLWLFKDRPLIKKRGLRYLTAAGVIIFAASFIIIESLILLNSSSQENIRTDYLIILGGGIKGETISLTLKERLDKGIAYMNQYPDTKAVVSGGQGFEEEITEAEAMKRYMIGKGIAPGRIIMEDKATSTMENFMFSKKVLYNLEDKDVSRIVIVTSDFHMFRAKMLAVRNKFEPYGITCSTPVSVRLNSFIREYFAFIKSLLFDR